MRLSRKKDKKPMVKETGKTSISQKNAAALDALLRIKGLRNEISHENHLLFNSPDVSIIETTYCFGEFA